MGGTVVASVPIYQGIHMKNVVFDAKNTKNTCFEHICLIPPICYQLHLNALLRAYIHMKNVVFDVKNTKNNCFEHIC